MPAQYVFALSLLIFGVLMVFTARYNVRHQKALVARTTENADKLAQQRAVTQELITRQTAALERVAEALERGKA